MLATAAELRQEFIVHKLLHIAIPYIELSTLCTLLALTHNVVRGSLGAREQARAFPAVVCDVRLAEWG